MAPTWPAIRDTLAVDEEKLLSVWLTGSFVNRDKEVTEDSDVDVIRAFESLYPMDDFEYDGRYPETVAVGGVDRELDPTIGGPETHYDDGESELLYCRTDKTPSSK